MYHDAINTQPSGLEKSYKEVIENAGLKDYAPMLLDYALLEIRDFYKKAWSKFKDGIEYPQTHEKVRVFRDNIIGHLKEDINISEILNEYTKINSAGGFSEIHTEWLSFRDAVFAKIDGE